MGVFQALAKFGTDAATMIAEDAAYREAAPAKSLEFWRAVRATKAQQTDALVRGGQAAAQVRAQGSLLTGTQKVAFAVNGVDSSSGSPDAVMAGSSMLAELDAQTVTANARREALGFKRAEQKLYTEARQEAAATKQRYIGNLIKIGGDFVGIAASGVGGSK